MSTLPARRSVIRQWLRSTTALVGSLPMLGLTISLAHANPQGGTVAQGSAVISQPDAKTVQVNQSSDRAVIDWKSFSIAAGETTRFVQPSSSSMTLNRVTGDQVSQILGNLQANGRVVLVNPNGIVFGAGSKIDVAALVASTANIKNENFMAGNMKFDIPGKANAQIVNEGTITAADGGLVAIVSPYLRNSGIISARLGKVALAAANGVTLDLYGDNLILFQASDKIASQIVGTDGKPVASLIENSGKIYADGGRVLMSANAAKGVVDNAINTTGLISARAVEQQGGEIVLKGEDAGIVQVSGSLDASGKEAGQIGGRAIVTGERVELSGKATIDASGDSGGGTILVGGDHMGGDLSPSEATAKGLRMEVSPIRTAENVRIGADVVLDASAIRMGNGGKIVAWANNSTEFFGNAFARGGWLGGDGGTVEISGNRRVVALGKVDVTAKKGKHGRYLIDPLGSLYASTADYFAELDTGTVAYLSDMHTDSDGALYVLSSKNASQVDFRTDPDGTKSYKTNIILTKIVDGMIVAQSVIDTIYGGSANGDGTARGALYVGGGALKVFFSEKTNGFSYAQEGYVYTIDKTTLDASAARQTLFTTANWGWNPYFDSNGNVNHFSFAGYYAVTNTTGGGFIWPDAFARQMYAARLANGNASGNPATLSNVTLSQALRDKAKAQATVNHAPTFMASVYSDITSNAVLGAQVSSLFGASISDSDGNPKGIAIYDLGTSATYGRWEYSLNGGAPWLTIFGASNTSAFLLPSSASLRFVQTSTASSAVQPTIKFFAWDQSSGTMYSSANATSRGSSTAFSSADGQAYIKINASTSNGNTNTSNSDINGTPGNSGPQFTDYGFNLTQNLANSIKNVQFDPSYKKAIGPEGLDVSRLSDAEVSQLQTKLAGLGVIGEHYRNQQIDDKYHTLVNTIKDDMNPKIDAAIADVYAASSPNPLEYAKTFFTATLSSATFITDIYSGGAGHAIKGAATLIKKSDDVADAARILKSANLGAYSMSIGKESAKSIETLANVLDSKAVKFLLANMKVSVGAGIEVINAQELARAINEDSMVKDLIKENGIAAADIAAGKVSGSKIMKILLIAPLAKAVPALATASTSALMENAELKEALKTIGDIATESLPLAGSFFEIAHNFRDIKENVENRTDAKAAIAEALIDARSKMSTMIFTEQRREKIQAIFDQANSYSLNDSVQASATP